MSETLLKDLIIQNGFKKEWLNKDHSIARIDIVANNVSYVPFNWSQRIFKEKSRGLDISKVLPSESCKIKFSATLKNNKIFLPFLSDELGGPPINYENISNSFPWNNYLEFKTYESGHSAKYQFELLNPANSIRFICSYISLTYIDQTYVTFD